MAVIHGYMYGFTMRPFTIDSEGKILPHDQEGVTIAISFNVEVAKKVWEIFDPSNENTYRNLKELPLHQAQVFTEEDKRLDAILDMADVKK